MGQRLSGDHTTGSATLTSITDAAVTALRGGSPRLARRSMKRWPAADLIQELPTGLPQHRINRRARPGLNRAEELKPMALIQRHILRIRAVEVSHLPVAVAL